MAQWLIRAAPSHAEGHATPEEWAGLYQDLSDVERDLDQMVGLLRLDRTLLFGVYYRMLRIKQAWIEYEPKILATKAR